MKDDGIILMRFNEIRENINIRLVGHNISFSDDELSAVLLLLSGPGIIWELKFGKWILLQPEYINAYAQAVIQTIKEDRFERGCIHESQVLNSNLNYKSSISGAPIDDERFILLAMHQSLVEKGLCIREHTESGPLLLFPTYYRRERPELTRHPAVLISYRFTGFLDEVYATLVVRLHHSSSFKHETLWKYAADFKTLSQKSLGIKMLRGPEGAGEIEIYFDPDIPLEEKMIFAKYVDEHLHANTSNLVRLRHYVCPHCGTPVGNREVAMERLTLGLKDMSCAKCDNSEKRVPLWDAMERVFADPEIAARVDALRKEAELILDSESRGRVLVGDVISTVSLAGQIAREVQTSDYGIDMEIEFKDNDGKPTAKRIYLQLKSGSSHLKFRKRDRSFVFRIKNERHAAYWRSQPAPVILIVRHAGGEMEFMNIRDYLRIHYRACGKDPRSIIFKGERFDVLSVRRWRDNVIDLGVS